MPMFNLGRGKPSTGFSVTSDDNVLNFLTGKSDYVSADQALKNSDIYSLIYQLSSDLANGRWVASSARTQGMLINPTVTSNDHSFWQSMYAQLLLGGEAFAYRWRNRNGIDTNWEYLRPSQVNTFLLQDGSGLIYNVTFDEPEIGVVQGIPQGDMIHMRLLSKNGGKTGISPLLALSNELDIKSASDRLTLHALKQAITAPGILSVTKGGLLTSDMKAKRSKQFVKQMNTSENGPIVLDDLETYTPLEIQGNVSQLLNQANWTGAQIAKVYGVSDSVINGDGDQQSSLAMMGNDYIKSLQRFAKSITSELQNKLTGEIALDLRPVVDPGGDGYATTISNLASSGTISTEQAQWLLKKSDYLPDDLPDLAPVTEGGE